MATEMQMHRFGCFLLNGNGGLEWAATTGDIEEARRIIVEMDEGNPEAMGFIIIPLPGAIHRDH